MLALKSPSKNWCESSLGGLLWVLALGAVVQSASSQGGLRFEITSKPGLLQSRQQGRLFVVLGQTNAPEPRLELGRTEADTPPAFACDATLGPGDTAAVDRTAYGFPLTNLAGVAAGHYWVQAVFDFNPDLRIPNGPGNLYSAPRRAFLDPAQGGTLRMELTQQLPADEAPADNTQVKFVKMQSERLSQFHHRPIFLRAAVVLPRDYDRETPRRYPVWVRIGGFNTRYTVMKRMLADSSEFRRFWMDPATPRFILLQLDGAGPFGDPYYVNSANNGPYGDALVNELLPYVEGRFRGIGQPRARVLSGTSTGGWVCLALQIFYPESFNGAWSSCPDPVDFRALQLVNIYEEPNAYVNGYGNERPSERTAGGDVIMTMRRETQMENLLGRGNSFARSGEQWGAWNAVFSPRGADGLPALIWDPESGRIDRAVAEAWRKYDLHLVLEKDWKTLGPKLRGKLHIAAAEADDYFLNNAMHLLDTFLQHADPPFEGKIAYGAGKRHGWFDLSPRQMLEEMNARTGAAAAKAGDGR